jgi:hypothetical protein
MFKNIPVEEQFYSNYVKIEELAHNSTIVADIVVL